MCLRERSLKDDGHRLYQLRLRTLLLLVTETAILLCIGRATDWAIFLDRKAVPATVVLFGTVFTLTWLLSEARSDPKRWTWIVGMAPAMWGLHQLVIWADRLHAWQYSDKFARPTAADFSRAAVVFWASLLIPLLAGCVAAILAFRRRVPSVWPLLEASIVAMPYVAGILVAAGVGFPGPGRLADLLAFVLLWASVLVGGSVAATGHNLGACVRQRTWGRFALSVGVVFVGMLYLFWFSAFVIYVDT